MENNTKLPRNDFERLCDRLVEEMDRIISDIPEQPPMDTRELSMPEQVQRYLEVVDDPQKWLTLIQRQGLRKTIDYALLMQKQLDRMVEHG